MVDMHHMRHRMHCMNPMDLMLMQTSKLKAFAPSIMGSTLKKSMAVEHLVDDWQMELSPFHVEAETKL